MGRYVSRDARDRSLGPAWKTPQPLNRKKPRNRCCFPSPLPHLKENPSKKNVLVSPAWFLYSLSAEAPNITRHAAVDAGRSFHLRKRRQKQVKDLAKPRGGSGKRPSGAEPSSLASAALSYSPRGLSSLVETKAVLKTSVSLAEAARCTH